MHPFLRETDSSSILAIQCLNKSLRDIVSTSWNQRGDCYISWVSWEQTPIFPVPVNSTPLFKAVIDSFSLTHFTYMWWVPKSYLHENIQWDFYIIQSLASSFLWIPSNLAWPKKYLPTQKSRLLVFRGNIQEVLTIFCVLGYGHPC